jgi:hypothetical protein
MTEHDENSPSRQAVPLDVPIVVGVGVCAIVLSRIYGTGLQPYGSDSAQYIEHLTRLETLDVWREPSFGSLEFLRMADGAFPPLMHFVTLILGQFSGHAAHEVLWTGLLWLVLLAVSVASVTLSLSGSKRAAAAAFCGAMLLPSLHGAACRYYYDLPMTAVLWMAAAVAFATFVSRPTIGGFVTGMLLCAANLVKWTALPYGLIMVGAVPAMALIEGGKDRRWRFQHSLAASVLAIVVMGGLSALFIKLVGPYDSFTAMLGEIGTDAPHGAPAGVDSLETGAVLSGIFARLEAPTVARLAFYPSRLLASVFSPVLLALTLLLSAFWVRRDRRGWIAVMVIVLGQWLFVLLRVPPLDDRFLITAAPALLIPAAMGWDLLRPRLRVALGAAVLVVGFAVAMDFHFNDSPSARTVAPTRPSTDKLSKIIRWGLADSVDQRGWVRRSQQAHDRQDVREALWAKLQRCTAQHFRLASGDPVVGGAGDVYWMRYRALYAHLEEGAERRTVPPICNDPPSGDTELALSGVQRGTLPVRPRCIGEERWQLERVIEVPGGVRDLAVWSPRDRQSCSGLSVELLSPKPEAVPEISP